MKTLISLYFLLLILAFTSTSFGYLIDSRPELSKNGVLTQNITILCNADDDGFCDMVCQDAVVCSFPEPLCLDCAGSSSTLLRTIFSRVNAFYEASTEPASPLDVALTLSIPNYILISTKSIYNFYKPWDSEDLKKQFAEFCPAESEVPLLAVMLDSQNRPTDLVYAFCQLSPEVAKDTTMVYPIHPKSNTKNQTPNPPTRK